MTQEFSPQDRHLQLAEIFGREWGVKRINGIANYYRSRIREVRRIDTEWAARLERFKEHKAQIELLVSRMRNPESRSMALMRNIFYITNMFPSETAGVFETEQKAGSYVYLDSLLRASAILSKVKIPHDPEMEATKYNFGGGVSFSVQFYNIDDRDSMKRMAREEALEALHYGAKTPFEKTARGKYIIQPNYLGFEPSVDE